jgi:hypothetical protein
VTVAFRVWRRPTVKPEGRLRTTAGELVIDDVREITWDAITDRDARAAGASDRDALLADLAGRPGRLFRIDFRLRKPDSRLALAADADLAADALAAIAASLGRLDRRSRTGPWTLGAMTLIGRLPGRAAGDLAAEAGVAKPVLKRRVRSLKELGLTESLKTGYSLSPRGRRFLVEATNAPGRHAAGGDPVNDGEIDP